MQITSTRTFLELRVGRHHVAEVILFVRRDAMEWFNALLAANSEEEQQQQFELWDLLSHSIIPRLCGDELEHYYQKKYPQRFPKEEIGAKNTTTSAAAPSKKRQRPTTTTKRGTKKAVAAAAAAAAAENATKDGRKVKDLYYAFGEHLHVAYKTEDVDIYESATLIFSGNSGNQNKHKAGSGGFQQLTKLSKRFLLWCYETKTKSSDDDNNEDDSAAAELSKEVVLQPEMVPMDELFRPEPLEEKANHNKDTGSKRRK